MAQSSSTMRMRPGLPCRAHGHVAKRPRPASVLLPTHRAVPRQRTTKVVCPASGAEFTSTVPRCALTIWRTMKRPRPRPSPVPTAPRGRGRGRRCAAAAPGDVAAVRHREPDGVDRASVEADPDQAARSPWRSALPIRFETTCTSRSASQSPARSPALAIDLRSGALCASSTTRPRRPRSRRRDGPGCRRRGARARGRASRRSCGSCASRLQRASASADDARRRRFLEHHRVHHDRAQRAAQVVAEHRGEHLVQAQRLGALLAARRRAAASAGRAR